LCDNYFLAKQIMNGINNILIDLHAELKANSDPKIAEGGKRYFKEAIKVYGIKTAEVGKIGKKYLKILKEQKKNKQEIFGLCEELWKSGYMEESFIACELAYSLHKEYEEKDIEIFEKWIKKYVSNWASCDTLCNHTVGSYIEMYPKNIEILKGWAKSESRWVKRASAVTLIIPARHGLFLDDIFEIADTLLMDSDDLVQKGYGWMLKAASQAHQNEVFDYVMKNKKTMPRTALRYAIEKMPADLRQKAMEKN
jgi:3-methyladenine DNA glycosylase AlkD